MSQKVERCYSAHCSLSLVPRRVPGGQEVLSTLLLHECAMQHPPKLTGYKLKVKTLPFKISLCGGQLQVTMGFILGYNSEGKDMSKNFYTEELLLTLH